MEFKYFLALELGMTVRELDTRMGSKEFSDWRRHYEQRYREDVARQNKAKVMGG